MLDEDKRKMDIYNNGSFVVDYPKTPKPRNKENSAFYIKLR